MRRREFLGVLGSAAVAWPHAANAQQTDRMRRVGVLVQTAGALSQERLEAFHREMRNLGWTNGTNVQFDIRSGDNTPARLPSLALPLIAQKPDVALAVGSLSVEVLQRLAPTLPIVFVTVVDPVGSGYVESMARPGGTTTGFAAFEYGLSAKWIELLKEISPQVTQVAVLRDAGNPSGIGQFAAIQTVAPSLGMDLRTIDVRNSATIERIVAALAQSSHQGLIVTSAGSVVHSDLIIMLAAKHRLPTVYPFRQFVTHGGLISYGPDLVDQHRRAAGYVDRILKGEKPSDLPVQAPTKYELVINLKTAKALGLTVPPALLARADEVIE
jgi:putative ABC transport system substrate-binding protein